MVMMKSLSEVVRGEREKKKKKKTVDM